MNRKGVIITLTDHLNRLESLLFEGSCIYTKDDEKRTIEAINFAMESIKVDMAYDLEYEKIEQNLYKDFCEFVARMVLRDDFEENAGSNAEFLCRKLSKLGIVKADEDKWVLAESEDK